MLGIIWQDTHDAEILSLSFSSSSQTNAKSGKSLESRYFLASGGRDRMIRLYDVKRLGSNPFEIFRCRMYLSIHQL